MQKKTKRTITLIFVSVLTVVMATVAVITAIKLNQAGTTPIAPTAPQIKSKAAETGLIVISSMQFQPNFLTVPPSQLVTVQNDDIVDHTVTANDGSFDTGTIAAESTATFTAPSSPGTYSFVDSLHSNVRELAGALTVSAELTQVSSNLLPVCLASFYAIPLSCNDSCTSNDYCPDDMVCSDGYCRNPDCVDEPECVCPNPSPTPTPSPSPSASPTPAPTPTPSPGASPTPPPGCWDQCVLSVDCPGSLICSGGRCVNPQCPEESDCLCYVGGVVSSPTPTPSGQIVQQVELPEAGITTPTIAILSAGAVTLLLGVVALIL